MPFVVDASITASWLMPEEADPAAEFALQALDSDRAVVPQIWWLEVRNILIVNERRGRIDVGMTDEALELLRRLPIDFDAATNEARLLLLARRHRLTVYDAAYLELATRQRLPLASLDEELLDAARREKVALLSENPMP
jgi:predicted nucleic acid-binding protein